MKTSENDAKYSSLNIGEMDKSRELYSKEGDNSSRFEGKTVPREHTIHVYVNYHVSKFYISHLHFGEVMTMSYFLFRLVQVCGNNILSFDITLCVYVLDIVYSP